MKPPIVIGLTGSIGMGKTTTARLFRDAGIPVWDADAAVARLYEKGGKGAKAIARLYPGAVADGAVDRAALRQIVAQDPDALTRLETAIHPLVAEDRARFLSEIQGDIVVLDIPLLFETGLDDQVDLTLVVTAPPLVQRARVLDRPGITVADFERILSRQMPDAEKRARADRILETTSLEATRADVRSLIAELRQDPKSRA